MALSITCSKISQDGAGRIHVAFSDGVEMEFPSKAEAIRWGQGDDVSGPEAALLLRQLLMSWWLKGDPTGATPSLVVGKTITANLTLANIATVA
jgi:hypothetical protein